MTPVKHATACQNEVHFYLLGITSFCIHRTCRKACLLLYHITDSKPSSVQLIYLTCLEDNSDTLAISSIYLRCTYITFYTLSERRKKGSNFVFLNHCLAGIFHFFIHTIKIEFLSKYFQEKMCPFKNLFVNVWVVVSVNKALNDYQIYLLNYYDVITDAVQK